MLMVVSGSETGPVVFDRVTVGLLLSSCRCVDCRLYVEYCNIVKYILEGSNPGKNSSYAGLITCQSADGCCKGR